MPFPQNAVRQQPQRRADTRPPGPAGSRPSAGRWPGGCTARPGGCPPRCPYTGRGATAAPPSHCGGTAPAAGGTPADTPPDRPAGLSHTDDGQPGSPDSFRCGDR